MKKSSADGKIYNIGVIMGNVYTAHPKELLHGIYDAAAKLPVNLQMFLGTQSNAFYRTMSNVASQENYDRQFNSVYDFALFGGLDALIIAYGTLCVFLNDDEKEHFFERYRGIPHIVLEDESNVENNGYIISDNYSGVMQIMNHLIEKHHYRKILHIRGPLDNRDASERCRAYLDAMQQHDLPVSDDMILLGDYSQYLDKEISEFFDSHPDAEAVCVANDDMAASVYRVCRKRGLVVGKDIAVTGYDNIKMASSMNPPLTTVSQNGYDIGYRALMSAVDLCCGKQPGGVRVPANPCLRESCGCSKIGNMGFLHGLERSTAKRMILQTSEYIVKRTMMNEENQEIRREYSAIIEQIVTYVIEEVFFRTDALDINTHVAAVQRMLEGVLQREMWRLVAPKEIANEINCFMLELVTIGPDCEKRLQIVRMMEALQEYILNVLCTAWSDLEIEYSRNAWGGPHYLRKVMEAGYREKETYERAMNELKRIGITDAFLLLFETPIPFDEKGCVAFPDTVYMAAQEKAGSVVAYDAEEMPVITRERGMSSFLEGKGHTFVTFTLFDQDVQYGTLMCEIKDDKISDAYVVSLHLATGLHFLEMNKKEYESKRRLEDAMVELQKNNQVLQYVSCQDDLTGLQNRRGLVESMLKDAEEREGQRAYMIFADLDHLKEINDNFGHAEGDCAIFTAAAALRECLGESALIARIGGDEFVAVLTAAEETVGRKMPQRIKAYLEEYNRTSGKPYLVECSIGMKEFVYENDMKVSQELEEADRLLYQAKRLRRKSVKRPL